MKRRVLAIFITGEKMVRGEIVLLKCICIALETVILILTSVVKSPFRNINYRANLKI